MFSIDESKNEIIKEKQTESSIDTNNRTATLQIAAAAEWYKQYEDRMLSQRNALFAAAFRPPVTISQQNTNHASPIHHSLNSSNSSSNSSQNTPSR